MTGHVGEACTVCGKPVELVTMQQWRHADGKTYRHPIRLDADQRGGRVGVEADRAYSELDRLRARVAELEGAGHALAEVASYSITTGDGDVLDGFQPVDRAAVAWRSAAGSPTTDTGKSVV